MEDDAVIWCYGRHNLIRRGMCRGCLFATNDGLREPCEYEYDEPWEVVRHKPIEWGVYRGTKLDRLRTVIDEPWKDGD